MPKGTVTKVFSDRHFGFINEDEPTTERGLFFHANDMLPALEFGEQLLEQRVEFELKDGRKGKCAVNVRAIH